MRSVILADLQDISKAGLLYLFANKKEVQPIHEAFSKKELIALLTVEKNAIVLLDYTTFDFTGSEDLLNVSFKFHEAHWILFSDELSSDFIRNQLQKSSNFSIVFKDSSKEEILSALNFALKDERYICNKASNQLLGKSQQTLDRQEFSLTNAERDILRLIALGKTNKEIAQERFSSIHTITTHRKNIFRKLEVNSVHEATKYALRAGILDSAEYYI